MIHQKQFQNLANMHWQEWREKCLEMSLKDAGMGPSREAGEGVEGMKYKTV